MTIAATDPLPLEDAWNTLQALRTEIGKAEICSSPPGFVSTRSASLTIFSHDISHRLRHLSYRVGALGATSRIR